MPARPVAPLIARPEEPRAATLRSRARSDRGLARQQTHRSVMTVVASTTPVAAVAEPVARSRSPVRRRSCASSWTGCPLRHRFRGGRQPAMQQRSSRRQVLGAGRAGEPGRVERYATTVITDGSVRRRRAHGGRERREPTCRGAERPAANANGRRSGRAGAPTPPRAGRRRCARRGTRPASRGGGGRRSSAGRSRPSRPTARSCRCRPAPSR